MVMMSVLPVRSPFQSALHALHAASIASSLPRCRSSVIVGVHAEYDLVAR